MNQVVVVGAGAWGRNLVRNFYQLGALAGVAEVNPDHRAIVAAAYPEVAIYETYEQVLALDQIAVVLATPAPLHYDMAIAALESGKDVFVEKPMALKAIESRHLAEVADQQGRILMVGHLLLYQPAITWMRDYLGSGKAGKVLHISTQRASLGKVRSQENVWWSFAPHDIAVVVELLGHPQLQQIQAYGRAMLQPGIEDYVHADLQFTSGQTAHIHCCWYWPEKQRGTVIIAEQQMLVYDEVRQMLTIHDKGVDAQFNGFDRGCRGIAVTADEPLRLECQHFLDCLKIRQPPRSDGWNGLAVVEILEQVQADLQKGAAHLPPIAHP